MGSRYAGMSIFAPEALESYIRGVSDVERMHAKCEDYRASATVDLLEQREDIKNGRKIQCPIRVLWGKEGTIEKCFDAIKEWEKVFASTVEGQSMECGHYIPEEKPEELIEHIEEFLK